MRIPVLTGLLSRFKTKNTSGLAAPAADVKTDAPTSWDDDLELTLGTLIADKESKSFGTVQAITLSDFRETIGDLWEQHQEKVLVIAETTIDRMLEKGHTAIRQEEDTWLLVTPDFTQSEAALFAKSIATAIGEKLVGERFEEEETDPTPQTGVVDLTEALNEDGTLNRNAIRQAVSAAKAVIAAQAAREKQQRKQKPEKLEPRHHMRPDAKQDKGDKPAGPIVAEEGLSVVYWPAWSSDSQAIDTFVCRPTAGDGNNPFGRIDPLLNAANAIAVARMCASALKKMIDDSIRAKLVVPIPYEVIKSPAQRQILKHLTRLHESHRFLYLRPEIVDVPHSASAAELLTVRDLLAPIGRDVAISLDIFDPNRAVLAAGKIVLGCDAGAEGDAQAVLNALRKIQSVAGKRKTFAIGLSERSSITGAVELGYHEVGGIGLQGVLKTRPTQTTPIPRDEFMASSQS